MKRVLLITCIGLSLSVIAQVAKPVPEKKLTVSMTKQEWGSLIQNLEYVKEKLKNSDLPAKEVTLISDSVITKFQNIAIPQLNQQLAADSSSKKK